MDEQIKTYVFLDTETTGLPKLENNTTKLTEFCLTAVLAEHLYTDNLPRVQDKLSLCFNPDKSIDPKASNLSGLDNNLLESKSKFDANIVELINKYLSVQKSPICFVAHNGNVFDYPIIREHFHRIGVPINEEILCIDSLQAFKDLDNKMRGHVTPRGYYSLGNIYKRLLNKEPVDAHQAEKDVEMMIACSVKYGQAFCEWANVHAKLFKDIPRMGDLNTVKGQEGPHFKNSKRALL